MNPVSLIDVAELLESVLKAYSPYIAFVFAVMVTFSILYGIKRLILGDRYI